MFGRDRCQVDVCARCEARARTRGVVDASGFAPVVRRALRRRGIGWSVKVREVPCLYRCPLEGVTVRAGGLPGQLHSGETRVLPDGHDRADSAAWAADACQRALDRLDDDA
jgi:hypothetical protein